MDALDWWKDNAVATSDNYPFIDKDGTCKPTTAVSPNLVSFGWDHTIPECKVEPCLNQQLYELQLVQRVMSGRQTMAIAYVDATNWQNYEGGLFPCDQCSSTLEAGNHVVEIVRHTHTQTHSIHTHHTHTHTHTHKHTLKINTHNYDNTLRQI